MWLFRPNSKDIIKQSWIEPILGCPMVILQKEIQRFKHILKAWKKYVFGNFIMFWLKKHVLSSAQQALENSVPFKMDPL